MVARSVEYIRQGWSYAPCKQNEYDVLVMMILGSPERIRTIEVPVLLSDYPTQGIVFL
jgi:hypothetical protein